MNVPAHIMMTTDAVGGVWVYSLALARRLVERGHRVTLVTLGPPPRDERRAEAAALPSDVELVVTDLQLEWLDPAGRDSARARAQLLKLAAQYRPDLVHINGYREAAIDWPCPSIAVAHSCVWSWWQAVHHQAPDAPQWRIYADAVRAGLNQANAWVAATQAFCRNIEDIYRPETFGHVIPNGIDLRLLRGPAKEPIILASGRIWDGGKNLLGLAQIAPALPWPIYIAGPGTPAGYEKSSNVHWLGEISHAELQTWMKRTSIYVAPAHYEPFGLGILEAARSGCALVLSDIPALRELWEGAALRVGCNDTQALKHSLLALCADRRALHRLQRMARAQAKKYSLDRTVEQYVDLYRHVATFGEVKARTASTQAKVFA